MMEEARSPSDDEIIRLAFELEGKRPTDLLLELGTLDLWRGDLSAMRDDTPPAPSVPEPETNLEAELRADDLYASVVMNNALQLMTEECRAVLYLRYVEHWDMSALADEFETSIDNAEQWVFLCWLRAHELVDKTEISALSFAAREPFVYRKSGIRQLPGKTRRAR